MTQPLFAIPGDVVDIETALPVACPNGCEAYDGLPARVFVTAEWRYGALADPVQDGYGDPTFDCIEISWVMTCCGCDLDTCTEEADALVSEWLEPACTLVPGGAGALR